MEKQIITFSANEQKLIKTGGIECYASNIVSYIEAHFDLGANWSGYDSVRAVWSNDNNMSVISTVLDSNGVCVVPFEVLKTKGIVKVNLVGSISVSDVLTDRLTSFPCEAVKVTAKAKIEGSETQPITPSQFEQFVQQVISEVEKVTGMTAQAETLPAGSQATARYEDGILYLGIPQGIQGERGETGADGNGIASVVYNADYTLTLVFDNGETFTTPPIRGERGERGEAGQDGADGRDGADGVTPNLSIGTVETLEPTQDAYVTRRGTDDNPIFDFGIPKGDTGEVTMSQLSALLPTDTASGDIASFPDGTDLFSALSVKAQIEPIQDLHGYDKPWSGGAGKNKLPNTATSATVSGVSYTVNDDGTIIANGASSGWGALAIGTVTLQSGSYVLSSGITSSSNYLEFLLDGTQINNNSLARKEFTLSEAKEITVKLYARPSTTATNLKLYPMIRLVTETDATYAPYSNICPISGHTECVTSVTGVNVWDEEWEYGRYSPTTGEATTEGGVRSKNFIEVAPNTDYFLACDTIASNDFRVLFYDEYKNYINANGWAYGNTTFTTRARAHYVKFFVTSSNYGTTYKNDISINYPSTDHEYHAYNGNTYTTTLGRTVYGGTLDVVSGELVVDRAMVDLGTLNWVYAPSYGGFFYSGGIADAVADGYECVSSAYNNIWLNSTAIENNDGAICINANGNGGVITGAAPIKSVVATNRAYTDASAFKTAMNGVQLCYELATPQTYQLDPQTIDLLLGDNNLWTDCGSVEVTYKADVGLYIDKKLSSNGTRSLSMGLTKSATVEAEAEETKTETEPSETETETK